MENKSFRAATLRSAFLCGAATISLSAVLASAAYAQGAGLETVVVTGTSIRGAVPTGSNVIAVDRDAIEASGAVTMQQLSSTIPAISGFGMSSKPSEGEQGLESTPTIHNFGESSSNSTLILMNGRPIMPQGSIAASDPSVIPSIAIQRVDVMPDGDSAVYGSSAVAGVINYVTRKDFEGMQTSLQFGRAQNYNRTNLGIMVGHGWDTGSIEFAYEYAGNSELFQSNRLFSASANLNSVGLANFNTLNCKPADISTANSGTANIYLYPYTNPTIGTQSSITTANSFPCDNSGNLQFFPSRASHTLYMDVQQEVAGFKVDWEAGYSYRTDDSKGTPGAITATVFGPTGSSAALGSLSRNPFFVGNTATGTASEFIRFDPFDLLGYSYTHQTASNLYENLYVTHDIAYGWETEVDETSSFNVDLTRNDNGYCGSCATLALNGTNNTGATLENTVSTTGVVDPFNLGNIASVVRPLTTSNALDVWDPAGPTNKTSPTVLKELMSDQTSSLFRVNYNDVKLKFDGPLFDLPAGSLKAAFGAEFSQTNFISDSSGSDGTGSSQTGGTNNNLFLPQTVQSIYLEFAVPIVGADMGVPLMQRLDLQVAGRIDGYSTTGWTHNPKLGLTWQVVDGLKFRGSFGTSFTAPNVTFVNGPNTIGGSTTTFTIPTSHLNYPGSFCTAPGAPNPCTTGGVFTGLNLAGPNKNLQPMIGTNYSAGIDLNGGQLWSVLSGLTANITYWRTRDDGVISLLSTIGAGYLTTPGLEQYLQIAPPGGWTATSPTVVAAIGANRVTGSLPPTIYFITDGVRANGISIDGDGIDMDTHYAYSAGDFGDFTWGYDVSAKLDWDAKGGGGSSPLPFTSYKNGRFNTSVILAEAYEARMSLDWTLDPLEIGFFWNYTNPYWFQTSSGPFAGCTATTQNLCPTGYPTGFPSSIYSGGWQRVKANDTFDLDMNLKLPEDWLDGWTKGSKLGINVRDLFNARPPSFNGGGGCSGASSCNGVDEFNGDSLQRVITFSIRKTF